MSLSPRCPFCVKLPLARAGTAGHPRRCPLCKAELLAVPGSGQTYRLATPGEPVAERAGRRRVVLTGLAVTALVGAALAARAALGPDDAGAAVQVAQLVPPAPRPAGPVRNSPWDEDEQAPERLPAPVREEPAAPRPVAPSWETIARPSVASEPAAVAVRRAEPPPPPRYLSRYDREQALRAMLARVPEVALAPEGAPRRKEARQYLQKQVQQIRDQTATDPDAFVKGLKHTRADLTGLPFLMGKDCRRDKEEAKNWDTLSRVVRAALGSAARSFRSASPSSSFTPAPDPARFWAFLDRGGPRGPLHTEEAIPALVQTLQAEHPVLRLSLTEYLGKAKGPSAGAALARRALFDPDPEVRELALAVLINRPPQEYASVLLEGLRYPLLPVAEHAAEAVVKLQLKDAIPRLVALLDEPDPDAPFLRTVNGKAVPVVRELVRVNHLGNCLLCHAPSLDSKEPVRGLVPVPGEAIPQVAYYSERRGGVFVRADITYLRQDFSVTLPVADSKPWPEQQRFDFLVRTRPLTEKERAAWEARAASPRTEALSEHRRVLLSALQGLTGEYAGTTAAHWRALLRELGPDRGVAAEILRRFGGGAVAGRGR